MGQAILILYPQRVKHLHAEDIEAILAETGVVEMRGRQENKFMKCPHCCMKLRFDATHCEACGIDVVPVRGIVTEIGKQGRMPKDPVAKVEIMKSYARLWELKRKAKEEE